MLEESYANFRRWQVNQQSSAKRLTPNSAFRNRIAIWQIRGEGKTGSANYIFSSGRKIAEDNAKVLGFSHLRNREISGLPLSPVFGFKPLFTAKISFSPRTWATGTNRVCPRSDTALRRSVDRESCG